MCVGRGYVCILSRGGSGLMIWLVAALELALGRVLLFAAVNPAFLTCPTHCRLGARIATCFDLLNTYLYLPC